MSYICPNCGNLTDFYTTQSGTCNYTCQARISGSNGDVIDTNDYDYDDFDGDDGDIECDDCGNDAEFIEDDEWREQNRLRDAGQDFDDNIGRYKPETESEDSEDSEELSWKDKMVGKK